MSPEPVTPGPESGPDAGAAARTVIDWDEALARMDGDADVLREICGIFQGDAPGLRAQLTAAVASDDLQALRFVAHNLKGASATLSATEVAALAGQLEQAATDGRRSDAHALAAAALAAFDRLLQALRSAEQRLRASA